ncbi:MAG: endonuclease/exonuclease/phosphatase family protein, partial [Pseudomonadota bacterium]
MARHLWIAAVLALGLAGSAVAQDLPKPEGAIRIATFNAALSRQGAGVLIDHIAKRDRQVRSVAEIVLRVRPDILLINEIDRDPDGLALDGFRALLAQGVRRLPGLDYLHAHLPQTNTGVPSGLDLDGDGRVAGPEDAWGFGRFPGQYGMAILSRFPFAGPMRSYRLFRWADLPGADRPTMSDGTPFHPDPVWEALRLSSKTHLIAPLQMPDGRTLSLIASHPTPPVFDGPEDRNGRRNADELRLVVGMIDNAPWLIDDMGKQGGVAEGQSFVVLGDLNADPADGEARRRGIADLLEHPQVQDPTPESDGGAEMAESQGGANRTHRTPAAQDTADWRDRPGPGNLRVDYMLPSADLLVLGSGVFWPAATDKLSRL